MRILVIGKTGQLGRSIQQLFLNDYYLLQGYDFEFIGRDKIDFEDSVSISAYFERCDFDVVINCVAYTQVEKAECEQKIANQVNHIAVEQLACIAHKNNIKLIHISTDYVFDGNSKYPYTEDDTPNPIITYAKTKLLGERAVQRNMISNAIIIRSGWIYSQHGNNFINSMLEKAKNGESLKIVADQVGTPVYVKDLIDAIFRIIDSKYFKYQDFPTSVYHFSNLGQCSWCEFAKEAFFISGLKSKITPITTKESGSTIRRPP